MSRTRSLRIVQITPGAGNMYCGACMRDNALVAALRRLGHDATMTPLYLPLTLDETDQSAGNPIFYSGVNVFLEQRTEFFRKAPDWLRKMMASPVMLEIAAGSAARTRPEDLGDITISMLRGEEGNQARELEELLGWLRVEKPDVICLSNALLVGLARRLRNELRVPVICTLQGEDWFLDSLPPVARGTAWMAAAERAKDVDLFIAPSKYFALLMQRRLHLPENRVRVVFNGINLDGYPEKLPATPVQSPPVLGYFARMSREKGLPILADAFLRLKKRDQVKNLKLRIGGSFGPADRVVVKELHASFVEAGVEGDVEFHPNLSHAAKVNFLRGLTVFSVPADYSESFGLYVIEALAAGVPVAQPDHSAFPEIVNSTGGGVLFPPKDSEACADAIEKLLLDPSAAHGMAQAGHRVVRERFNVEVMAREVAALCREAVASFSNS